MYIDTHCHIDDKRYTDIDSVINEYLRDGITKVINVGCNVKSSIDGKNLAEKYDSVYFAAGFHPSDINDFNDSSLNEIKKLLSHKKCVAVGEIGLDYHWQPYDKNLQQKGFISQLEVAKEYKLPVSVHLRDATEDAIKLFKDNKDKLAYGGVIHCFSGSVETAKTLLDLGFYIGFGGTLTFKNANKLLDVARYVPIDKCLTETDSPYLAPHPHRGETNTPKHIPLVVYKLADLKGVSMEEMANAVYNNAHELFKKL